MKFKYLFRVDFVDGCTSSVSSRNFLHNGISPARQAPLVSHLPQISNTTQVVVLRGRLCTLHALDLKTIKALLHAAMGSAQQKHEAGAQAHFPPTHLFEPSGDDFCSERASCKRSAATHDFGHGHLFPRGFGTLCTEPKAALNSINKGA
eukprot:3418938-Amphidinium_carterae.1